MFNPDWSSGFILPKKMMRKIESLMAAFFQSDEVKSHCCAKVAWADVCKLKKEGGLGLIDLGLRNK